MELFEEPRAALGPEPTKPKAAIADQKAAELACGRDLPSELFEMKLLGRRILVVRELPEEKTVAGIIIPDTVQDKHPKSAGWVVSAAPFVGEFEGSFAVFAHFLPQEILLRKFLFGRYAGIGLPVMGKDGRTRGSTDYGPEFIMMLDEDLMAEL